MEKIIIKVKGMVCNGCENRIKNAIEQIEGVKQVIADYKKGMFYVSVYDLIPHI